MGISSAMYSGVSGLNTNSHAMTVIGNNLANTNTLGFKGSRTIFSDLLSSSITGSGGVSQVGRGVNVSTIDNIYSQGTFESTESGLDCAIQGDGFFLLKQEGDNTTYYSRAGAFRFDEEGFLINPEGYHIQGMKYQVNSATGQTELAPGDPTDIKVDNQGLISGKATTTAIITTNLDSTEEIKPMAAFDALNPETYNYSSSTEIYDSLGNPHLITHYFNKTADNTWTWSYSYTNAAGALTVTQGNINGAPGSLSFLDNGMLQDPNPATTEKESTTGLIPAIDWGNGTAAQEIAITFDFTQFNSASNVISQDQNGYGPGELLGVEIVENGVVMAKYSNGEQVPVANIVLGKFTNPNGLESVGTNLYAATGTSGVCRTGLPGSELGKIFTNSLEQSNVDMGQEFVRMISVQRGFQANSKIITTIDELLGEIINLKR